MLWLAALPLAVHLQAVDAATGAGLPAQVTVTAAGSTRVALPAEGADQALPAGPFEVLVEAGGHAPLRARFDLADGDALPITFVLDAAAPPAPSLEALADGGLGAQSRRDVSPQGPRDGIHSRRVPPDGNAAVLQGFVRDEQARPVAAATVALPAQALQARTDAAGFFRLSVPVPTAPRPQLATLRISAGGFAVHEVVGVLLAPGATVLRETLVRGAGSDRRDDTPKVLRPGGDAPPAPPPPFRGAEEDVARAPGPGGALAVLDPPASIRVGTACSCSTCGAVSVMSLETYVARGLNDEWIASWHPNSLRAGAVAYRSYGSWYVEHPLSGSYDICSTTCCQVNDADSSAATDAAAARTAGYLLERTGAVFRAEYSAENNAWDDPGDGLSCTNVDLSCGDGLAGSPATGWPCLADGVDAGHGCFGHGRGACQWGTQRWASGPGQSWTWILDHYYNDHGAGTGLRTAHMATPVALQQAAAPPRVGRGQRFTLQATAANLAELPQQHVLIGASLRRGARVLSDPAHDAPVVLAPGTGTASRFFDVPRFAPLGTYDLLVALYEDVDENGAIGGADLPLQLLTLPGAVRVCIRAVSCPEP